MSITKEEFVNKALSDLKKRKAKKEKQKEFEFNQCLYHSHQRIHAAYKSGTLFRRGK